MGLRLHEAPEIEPITVEEAVDHLRLEVGEHDELVYALIQAARSHVETETRRALMTQTWDLTIDYEWPDRIVLPKPPLQSVTSITYVDQAGATQTLASNQYQVNASSDEGVIERAYGVSWPSVRRQMNAITVRFVAGYETVPPGIIHAMKMLIAHWYAIPEATVVGTIVGTTPMAVDSLLFPYRVFY